MGEAVDASVDCALGKLLDDGMHRGAHAMFFHVADDLRGEFRPEIRPRRTGAIHHQLLHIGLVREQAIEELHRLGPLRRAKAVPIARHPAAGVTDRGAGGENARTEQRARALALAQIVDEAGHISGVKDRRDAEVEVTAQGGFGDLEVHRDACRVLKAAPLAGPDNMDMDVHQPGDQKLARAVDPAHARGHAPPRRHGRNPIAPHDDGGIW